MTTPELVRSHVCGVHSVERAIEHRMDYYAELLELQIRRLGYGEMLRRHYVEGSPHPDDVNQPLHLWEETP
jgi:hypothetical protein